MGVFRKIDASSASNITSALSFFETPPSNVGISSSRYEEILTLNPVEQPPYHFRIHASSAYIDLSHIFLQTEMHIEKLNNGKWENLTTNDKVAPIQAIGATWIEDMRVVMNGRETFNANKLYAYKSYFDIELSFPTDVKENYLGIIAYFPCRMKKAVGVGEPHPNQDSEEDTGYQKRRDMFSGNKSVQLYSRLNADIFSSDLYFINAVPIDIEIHPNRREFLLHQVEGKPVRAAGATEDPLPQEWRLVITNVKMYVRTVELMDGLALEIAKHLETHPARYGIRRSELKSIYISQGRFEMQANIFAEHVPRRIIIGLVEAVAFNGHVYKSPFVFGNYRVTEMTVSVGGIIVPAVRYQIDYDNNRYMRPYHDMMEGVGLANSIETNGISPYYYKHGWAIYVFTMAGDLNSEGFELMKSGTTSIYVHFARPLPHGVNMVVYGELDSLLMVDANRTLTTDLTVW